MVTLPEAYSVLAVDLLISTGEYTIVLAVFKFHFVAYIPALPFGAIKRPPFTPAKNDAGISFAVASSVMLITVGYVCKLIVLEASTCRSPRRVRFVIGASLNNLEEVISCKLWISTVVRLE